MMIEPRLKRPAKNTRSKGLDFAREVKKILEALGHRVEGPGYIVMHVPERPEGFSQCKRTVPIQVHRDYLGGFDLISYRKGTGMIGHQVSVYEKTREKIRLLQGLELAGWVWVRLTGEDRRVTYRVFEVTGDNITEHDTDYLLPKKEGKDGKDRRPLRQKDKEGRDLLKWQDPGRAGHDLQEQAEGDGEASRLRGDDSDGG